MGPGDADGVLPVKSMRVKASTSMAGLAEAADVSLDSPTGADTALWGSIVAKVLANGLYGACCTD